MNIREGDMFEKSSDGMVFSVKRIVKDMATAPSATLE